MTDSAAEQSQPCFEDALKQLEHVVHDLEEGQIGLAEALARYEQGVRLLKQCYGLLETAQRRIEVLSGVDAQGNLVTQAFDDEASLTIEQTGQRRNRRRASQPAGGKPQSEPASPPSTVDDPRSLF